MTDDEVRALALLLLPYRRRVEAVWKATPGTAATAPAAGRLLTVPGAAERLGCSRWHVYDLVGKGRLSASYGGKNGNLLRINERDLQAYIDSTKAKPLRREPR
jgi:excisionase family DNA binding protein